MNNFGQTSLAIAPAPDETTTARESTTPFALTWPGTLWPPDETKRLVELYVARPLFDDSAEWLIRDNPYCRPIDRESIQQFDFSRALSKSEALGASALAAHRMLLNIYETDLIFLPEKNFAARKNDFASFYSNDNKLLGELIRPALEAHVFDFLEHEINISGKWTLEAVKTYLQELVAKHEQSELELCTAIVSSADPVRAGRSLLVQLACDFLSEASASARNILGKYGEIQSEFFKIVIDDYGYGVHPAKHSTLYENTLATAELISEVHAYWKFYLSSTLALANYYHYVSRDHSKYFRAIGAIAVAESMFSHTCRKVSQMLRTVFGKNVDTYYFDEHFHIDAHHGRMAFEHVVAPAIERYGNGVIPDIVRGMEELQLLTAIADEDFIAQVSFCDTVADLKAAAQKIQARIVDGSLQQSAVTHLGTSNQPFITRVSNHDQLFAVQSGTIDLVLGPDQTVRLDRGDVMIVPRQRLHGTAIVSEESQYRVYEFEDYRSCLS
ncbi:MAG TPA: iron-containing redox enzyme family protein [Pyrinomonadaceae bacterium]|nr:iron-containing redox enzyme family protein [Pyrinomonadaceae bacterium]